MLEVLHHQKSLLKVVVLGDAGVGKTSLVKQYIDGNFDSQYKPTIGADFLTKDISLPNRGDFKFQIWDTAGQERFRSIAASFYRGADACVLVYDISDIKTFQNLDRWMKEFLESSGAENSKNFPFVVLGNKSDMSDEMMVSKSRAQAWCKSKPNVSFFETSALSKLNVVEAFNAVAVAAGGCLPPPVSLVNVKDLDISFAANNALAAESDHEPNGCSGNLRNTKDKQTSRRVETRRESSDEVEHKGRKKTRKRKSSRKNSITGSNTNSKYSQNDISRKTQRSNRSSRRTSKTDAQLAKEVRSSRRSHAETELFNDDVISRSSHESPRGGRHSRRSTRSLRSGKIGTIKLDEDDQYSTESEEYAGCCG